MEAKQRHYEVLNNNIFRNLLNIDLSRNESEESIFKTYVNRLPVNGYKYEDALLHLQERGAKKLYDDIEKYGNVVSSTNTFVENSNKEIITKINNKISEASLDDKHPEDSESMKKIRNWTAHHLLQAYNARDVNEYAHKLDPDLGGAGVNEREKQVIISVLRDNDIIEKLRELKEKDVELRDIIN